MIEDEKNQPIAKVGSTSSVSSSEEAKKHFIYDEELRKSRFNKKPNLTDILTIFCAGFALISDGYQNNVMTMLNPTFTKLYPKTYDADLKAAVSNASTVGTILGQVAIGFATDLISRKTAIVIATLFLILGTILCAAAHGKTDYGMFWMLIIARGVTGFGIGAEYPSSSVSANEAANESHKRRGFPFVMCTNFPLSFGGPLALCIFLIVYQITKVHDGLWRAMYAIGAFLPLSVFYFRMKLISSILFKKSKINRNVPYWLAFKFYWKRLFGTCVCWFLYDFVTFPNGIFSATIISNVLKGSAKGDLEKTAEWTLLLTTICLPGVFIGAYICDFIGRRNTLCLGFSGYIVFGLIIGIAFKKISNIVPLFIVFYGIFMSFGNLGPGCMMGLVSSESFATPMRGTAYGISAAIGKVGAVVGTKVFTPIEDNLGQGWTFIIAAICGLVGVLVGWFFIPQLKDDDLMQEDIKFKNYLLDHGWTGHFGTDEVVDLEKERAIDDDLVNDSDVEQKKEQLEYQKQFIH